MEKNGYMQRRVMMAMAALFTALLPASQAMADDWNTIKQSGDYYYGQATAATEAEADKAALADLSSMIAVNMEHEFTGIDEEKNSNGAFDHQSKVVSCIKTYTRSLLTNVEKEKVGKEPKITVRRWMKRSELHKIYSDRIEKVKDFVRLADLNLKTRDIDLALQYYYWAYSLVRSVQKPNELKDDEGHGLMAYLPGQIERILKNVKVSYEKREDNCIDLLFTYKGDPISGLVYTYNDGNEQITGTAKDGRGTLYMAHEMADAKSYQLDIDYELRSQAEGDKDMESVLSIVSKKMFRQAHVDIRAKAEGNVEAIAAKTGLDLNPTASQLVAKDDEQQKADVVAQVVEAISTKDYSSATSHFTSEGLRRYNKLIAYGKGRVVGTPNLKFFKGMGGHTVARGMQMSFNFKTSRKSYTEDVVFTLDSLGKIDNVSFGLGDIASNDILCKNSSWSDDTKEMLMEFLENYKTAYCLKDIDYLERVFSDDAVIIVGNVVRPSLTTQKGSERPMTVRGQEIIRENRYTKDQYLKNLRRCFARNEFINIRFTNNDIQWLDKIRDAEKYGIQIGQEYSSSTYADMGYLFLLVDMTDHQNPQIEKRTWQPNEVSQDRIYNAGYFYDF